MSSLKEKDNLNTESQAKALTLKNVALSWSKEKSVSEKERKKSENDEPEKTCGEMVVENDEPEKTCGEMVVENDVEMESENEADRDLTGTTNCTPITKSIQNTDLTDVENPYCGEKLENSVEENIEEGITATQFTDGRVTSLDHSKTSTTTDESKQEKCLWDEKLSEIQKQEDSHSKSVTEFKDSSLKDQPNYQTTEWDSQSKDRLENQTDKLEDSCTKLDSKSLESSTKQDSQSQDNFTKQDSQIQDNYTKLDSKSLESSTKQDSQSQDNFTKQDSQIQYNYTKQDTQSQEPCTKHESQSQDNFTKQDSQSQLSYTKQDTQLQERCTDQESQLQDCSLNQDSQLQNSSTNQNSQLRNSSTNQDSKLRNSFTNQETQSQESFRDQESQSQDSSTSQASQLQDSFTNEDTPFQKKSTNQNSQSQASCADTIDQSQNSYTSQNDQSEANKDWEIKDNRVKYEYFWKNHSPFSQWYYSKFTIDGTTYNCAEQFMMHRKAILMEDYKTANKIMMTKNPRDQKSLGRQVKHFNQQMWDDNCMAVVEEGNEAKFSQDIDLKNDLYSTYPKTLVEASPLDKIWGIGLAEDNPLAWDESNWNGKNLLGYALTRVRDRMMRKENIIQ